MRLEIIITYFTSNYAKAPVPLRTHRYIMIIIKVHESKKLGKSNYEHNTPFCHVHRPKTSAAAFREWPKPSCQWQHPFGNSRNLLTADGAHSATPESFLLLAAAFREYPKASRRGQQHFGNARNLAAALRGTCKSMIYYFFMPQRKVSVNNRCSNVRILAMVKIYASIKLNQYPNVQVSDTTADAQSI